MVSCVNKGSSNKLQSKKKELEKELQLSLSVTNTLYQPVLSGKKIESLIPSMGRLSKNHWNWYGPNPTSKRDENTLLIVSKLTDRLLIRHSLKFAITVSFWRNPISIVSL